ncbi:glycosyltransferase [Kineosporia sp. NBRC 101731]|uniref:glycosyltransferase n=1 Tax=Kineosporia sp. NBRC 101731 TaxID=3032199 RepID=UPI00255473A7|nr:glycosyltransferase [Kineosporia sp. NBRC 101731]
MRIALLAHLHHPIAEPFAGGMEMHTHLVADELVRRGHDVTLFARENSSTSARLEPILDDSFVYGAVRHSHSRDEVLDTAMRRALARIEDGGFDLVLNNSLSPLPYRDLAGHPMLTVLHTPPTLEKVNAVIEAPGWEPGPRHAFVAVSRFTAMAWRSLLPEVGVVPNGIDLDQWRAVAGQERGLAVWSARITPEKGLHLAIDAARAAGMHLEFTGIVGDPQYFEDEIRPRTGPDVRYRGHLTHEQLASQMSKAEVFLATPLWDEPFGLAMVEAMACGTPVAALPNGACPEVVLPSGGAVADKASVDGLAAAIDVARTMNRRKVRRHARRYDARTMMNQYEALMLELTGTSQAVSAVESAVGAGPLPDALSA